METESIAATPESSSVDPVQPSTSAETPPVIVVQTECKKTYHIAVRIYRHWTFIEN
jgi:hypothetical protein